MTTQVATIHWAGISGKTYQYWIYPIGTDLSETPGNYVFAKEISPNRWTPVYIGETADLSERFDNHHKMPCIKRNGATHIHAHKSPENRTVRLAEETDLVNKWHPVCNG